MNSTNLLNAIERNMMQYLSRYCRSSKSSICEEKQFTVLLSGIPFPLFNGVFLSNFEHKESEQLIQRIATKAQKKKIPMFWWVSSSTLPKDLGNHLERQGFVNAGEISAMAIDLDALSSKETSVNLVIKPVNDISTLREWIHVVTVGSELPKSISDDLVNLEISMEISQNTNLHRYVGYVDEVPVTSAALLLDLEVAGVYVIATIPEFRRRGFGTKMTLSVLKEAQKNGHHVGVLQSSIMGHSLYQKLGFQEVGKFELYLYDPL